jgi:cytoskeleton protein RodZ
MSEQAAGPGSTLRAEREALGVTLREVSETLNLSIGIIQSIEADEYERLPGPVFARGYVRAYARLLDLEPDPLLARSPQWDNVASDRHLTGPDSLREWLRRRPGLVLGAGVLLLAVAVAVAAVWLWPHLQPTDRDEAPVAARSALSGADDMPVPAGPLRSGAPADVTAEPEVFREQGEAIDEPAEAVLELDVGDVAAPSDAPPPAATAARSQGPAALAPPGMPRRITPAGDDRLVLRFSADCWVQVRDAEGNDLYGELSRAGDDLELVGQGPLRILLGYAPGAQLAFNGEPVPLGPHTRNNVATLVLGQ